jgi:hypothetical protein
LLQLAVSATAHPEKSVHAVFVKVAIFSLLIATLLRGQATSTETWVNTPRVLRLDDLDKLVDVANAAAYKSGAADLIRQTIGIEPRGLTFVIHVVRWSEGGEIVKQNWFVYQSDVNRTGPWTDAQFATAKRIYGKSQIWFLYIQLNARSSANTTYVFQTRKKAPAFFTHLETAAGLFGVSLPMAGEAHNIWNARVVNIPYVPSDVTMTPQFVGGSAATFDNEGLSWIDFSAAVPVTKTSTPAMFAVVDLYLKPADIKSTMGFDSWPHLVEGVRVGSQPLKNILLGVGWGPVYGGVLVGNGNYTFSFGLNISASAAMKK